MSKLISKLLIFLLLFFPLLVFAKDSLFIGINLSPSSLNPNKNAAAIVRKITYQNVLQGLTAVDQNDNVIPNLASSWEINSKKNVYIFHLHKGILFSNNKELTANIVVKVINSFLAKNTLNPHKELFANIKEVKKIDKYTIKFILKKPSIVLAYNLARGNAVMVYPQNSVIPIGTGPYKITEFIINNKITLNATKLYWGDKVFFKKVIFKVIPEPLVAIIALKTGDLDIYPDFIYPNLAKSLKGNSKLKIVYGNTTGKVEIVLNKRRYPFSEINFRKALFYGLDRKKIATIAMGDNTHLIASHYSFITKGYVDLNKTYPLNTALAKKLLNKYLPLKFNLVVPNFNYATQSAQIISSQLRKLGIKTNIKTINFNQWLADIYLGKHDFDATIISFSSPLDLGRFASKNSFDGYKDKVFDRIYNKIQNSTNKSELKSLYILAQKRLNKQAANIFLFNMPKISIMRRDLFGIWINDVLPNINITKAYLK